MITSGGEIPYRVVGATGAQGVEYKPYGITLKVTPEERMNDVLLQLNLESSEPVGTVNGTSENPLTSRSIDLNVAVEKDKTLAHRRSLQRRHLPRNPGRLALSVVCDFLIHARSGR